MKLFEIFGSLGLDDSEFRTKVNSATSLGESMTGKLRATTIAAGQLLANYTQRAITGVINLAKTGFEYNQQMENYTTNFGVMLGSTEKAVKKVQELKDLAARTPFGMADLADATQTLLAFQVPSERTNDIMSRLGDIALGNKEKLSGLALVYGQISSNGKLMGQDLLQMINQGFNPLIYIANRTGESMEKLRARMAAGKITAEEVTQAINDATSEGGQFYKGMDEASKTTTGLLSTLNDNWQAFLGTVTEPFNDQFKDTVLPKAIESITGLTEFMTVRKPEIDSFASSVGELASGALQGLVDGIESLVLYPDKAEKFFYTLKWGGIAALTALSPVSGVITAILTGITQVAEKSSYITGEYQLSQATVFKDPYTGNNLVSYGPLADSEFAGQTLTYDKSGKLIDTTQKPKTLFELLRDLIPKEGPISIVANDVSVTAPASGVSSGGGGGGGGAVAGIGQELAGTAASRASTGATLALEAFAKTVSQIGAGGATTGAGGENIFVAFAEKAKEKYEDSAGKASLAWQNALASISAAAQTTGADIVAAGETTGIWTQFSTKVVSAWKVVTSAIGAAINAAKTFNSLGWGSGVSLSPGSSAVSPGGGGGGGSGFATGIDYVPNKGLYLLHRGETVLTETESELHRNAKTQAQRGTQNLGFSPADLAAAVKAALSGMGVLLDGQAVGRIQERTISRIQGDAISAGRFS